MALTHDDIARLTAVFEPHEHWFDPKDLVYLAEEAVATRLDEVCPSWEFIRLAPPQRVKTDAGEQVVAEYRLILNGVARDDVGMAETTLTKRDGEIRDKEAEKMAVTDAFRRCARKFGVGRYLLKAKGVNKQNLVQFLDAIASGKNWNIPNALPAQTSQRFTPPPADKSETMEVELHRGEMKQTAKGEGYIVYATADGLFTVNVFKGDRARFDGLPQDKPFPDVFNATIVRNGKYWNLAQVNSF